MSIVLDEKSISVLLLLWSIAATPVIAISGFSSLGFISRGLTTAIPSGPPKYILPYFPTAMASL